MNEPLYRLRNICAGYLPDRRVLDGLNLDLHVGDRIALVGANGAGKSTLLELMIGLMRPLSGEVWAFGKVREEDSDYVDVRQRAGLLFEDPDDQLFHITVAEDVAFGPFNLGWDRARVAAAVTEVLALLDLGGYEERITYRLSRGEKRMVSLATVLVMEPDVLLLDEPTAGLDERHTERLIDVLRARSRTLLVVSHDRAFLEAVTDQSLTLVDGRLA